MAMYSIQSTLQNNHRIEDSPLKEPYLGLIITNIKILGWGGKL